MNRKWNYVFGLAGFFLMWGVFGFAAAAPRGEPDLAATVLPVATTVIVPEATNLAGVPITGEPEPVWTEILVFYGLIGLTALFLILALLSLANKSTAPYAQHKGPPSEETPKN
jgi:hypothetical protein